MARSRNAVSAQKMAAVERQAREDVADALYGTIPGWHSFSPDMQRFLLLRFNTESNAEAFRQLDGNPDTQNTRNVWMHHLQHENPLFAAAVTLVQARPDTSFDAVTESAFLSEVLRTLNALKHVRDDPESKPNERISASKAILDFVQNNYRIGRHRQVQQAVRTPEIQRITTPDGITIESAKGWQG